MCSWTCSDGLGSAVVHRGHSRGLRLGEWLPRTLLLAVGVAAAIGCTARPIPLAVQAGSTFVFPIAGDGFEFIFGFDSEDLAYQDPQFGRTLFVLQDAVGDVVLGGVDPVWGGPVYPLRTRWITSAWPHPASPAGIAGDAGQGRISQFFAVIDVHPNTPPGTYTWKVRTEMRPGIPVPDPNMQGDLFRMFTPFAAQGMEDFLGEFVVLPAPSPPDPPEGQPTPSEGNWGGINFDLQDGMRDLIPLHVVSFSFSPIVVFTYPAAADIKLSYPSTKINVKTVYESGTLGRGSILRFDADPTTGVLTIHLVDPDESVVGVSVAFQLINPTTTGPIWTGDFVEFGGSGFDVLDEHYYDKTGVEKFSFQLGMSSIR